MQQTFYLFHCEPGCATTWTSGLAGAVENFKQYTPFSMSLGNAQASSPSLRRGILQHGPLSRFRNSSKLPRMFPNYYLNKD